MEVVVTRPDADFTLVPGQQLAILRRMSVPIYQAEALAQVAQPRAGHRRYYRLQSERRAAWRGRRADPLGQRGGHADPGPGCALRRGHDHGRRLRSGHPGHGHHDASPAQGLACAAPGVAEVVGELYLADISVPPALYAGPALELRVGQIFAHSDIVQLA
ncbi:MAG: hypothetical protein V9H69_19345 [Anaerolineae bacterium]